MLKNDYRRALIMLRPLEVSWCGHIRLERRTLMGSMQFTVAGVGSGERLAAMLVATRSGRMQIHRLGELRNGGRGQAGMRCEFDPRDMSGLTLEQYDLIVIGSWNGDGWRMVMAGYPNGSRAVDWAAVHAAVGRLERAEAANLADGQADAQAEDAAQAEMLANPAYPEWSDPDGTETPAGAVSETEDGFHPARPEPVKGMQKIEASAAEEAESENWPEEFDVSAEPDSQALLENPMYPEWANPDGADTPAGAVTEEEDAFHIPKVPDPEEDEPPGEWAAWDIPAQEAEPLDVPAREDDVQIAERETALAHLQAQDAEWPESIAPLKSLFAASPPWPESLEDGFVFVQAAMPQGCGYEHTLIGVRAEDGKPAEVMYAIPSPFSAEPPPGLEDYSWKDGFWVFRHETGGV